MLAGELEQQPASRYYLVAEDDGRIAGYAGLLGAGWQGDVLTLAVATDRWGRGIGSALLGRCWPRRPGAAAPRSSSRCAPTTAGRSELYRRHEFTEIGIRRGLLPALWRRRAGDAPQPGRAPRPGEQT